jgi:DNA-binding transcriptional LysR family regulator
MGCIFPNDSEMSTSEKRRGEAEDRRNAAKGEALPRLRFRLEDLETFLSVAETRSFSRAAEALGLSQPSVSSRIQRLETSVGFPLLQRTTRRVEVNEHGARLRSAAEAALRDLRVLLREFRDEADAKKKRMTLAATPLLAAAVLLPLIRRYMEQHPGVEIRLHDVGLQHALAEVASGAADMAIMVFDGGHPDFNFELLTAEDCVIVTPPNHPLLAKGDASFEDIADFPVLLPEAYQSIREVLEAEYRKRGLQSKSVVQMREVSNISTVIGMVAAGMGITFAPRTLISREQRSSIGVVRPKGFRLERCYGIVTARNRPSSPVVRSFARFVRSSIPPGRRGWA